MRSLIYIPEVHGPEEGGLTKSFSTQELRALGIGTSKTNEVSQQASEILWKSIDREMTGLGEDFTGVKVFTEGLETKMPEIKEHGPYILAKTLYELEKPGGPGNALFMGLYFSGATMIPTEDPVFLQQLDQELFIAVNKLKGLITKEDVESLRVLYERRCSYWDENIPKIIDGNLKEGEKGIVIAGIAHDAISNLPDDIKVSFISLESELMWRIEHEGQGLTREERTRMFLESVGPNSTGGKERA